MSFNISSDLANKRSAFSSVVRRFRFFAVCTFAVAIVSFGSASAKPKVLLVHTDTQANAADVQTKLTTTNAFDSVDLLNVQAMTPTLASLQQYNAILVWSSTNPYHDPAGLGNVVAAYQAAGGGVVCGMLEPTVQANGFMTGAWNNDYRVWERTNFGAVFGGSVEMIPVLPNHPLLTDVTTVTLNGFFVDLNPTQTAGATLVANSSKESPFVATKVVNGHPVVDLGFSPPSRSSSAIGWDPETDGAILMKNALLYSINGSVSSIDCWREFE